MAETQANSNNRVFPMALMPWWDVQAAVNEAKRCAKMGLRGVNTNSDPNDHGMPDLSDPAWYPLWEVCSDLDLPVNFHIGASDATMDAIGPGVWPSHGKDEGVVWSVMLFLNNCRVMTNILVSRFLEKFPKLKIVSVESGVGWIPFMLEAVEYQMHEADTKYTVPVDEIFRRQIYACSWFERKSIVPMARMIGVDNLLFETDFPHTTCLYPNALQYVADAAAAFTPEERRKVFGGNAARVYNLPLAI
jgi:predicted TIM-barrel fold metal-dependent hydrolase